MQSESHPLINAYSCKWGSRHTKVVTCGWIKDLWKDLPTKRKMIEKAYKSSRNTEAEFRLWTYWRIILVIYLLIFSLPCLSLHKSLHQPIYQTPPKCGSIMSQYATEFLLSNLEGILWVNITKSEHMATSWSTHNEQMFSNRQRVLHMATYWYRRP